MRIILTGSGIAIYFLAKRFISKGYQISIITDNEADADYYSRNLKALVLLGSVSDIGLLGEAQGKIADIFIGMTQRDQDNLVICLMAREYFQIPHILSVVNDPDNEEIFSKLGVRAVSNSRFLIESIESMSSLEDIRQQISLVEGRVIVTEVEVQAEAKATGKMLREIEIPYNALVATVLRGEEVIIPRGSTQILAGDRILLITQPDTHSQVLRIFT
jgi:trk system potassium uptake protein TrkA